MEIKEMSQNVAKLNQKTRLEIIENELLFKTLEEIAEECKVTRRTIDRDIRKWKDRGGFDRFLEQEFFQLYGIEKRVNPSRALDRIITLMIRRMTENPVAEVPHNVKVMIIDNSITTSQTETKQTNIYNTDSKL
jgi:hypothetical protein